MKQNKNKKFFLYTFFHLALFSVFFLSFSNTVKAEASFLLCINDSQKTYVALLSENCPSSFNLVDANYDLSEYTPISITDLNSGSGNNNNNNTNIGTTSQNNLQNNTQPIISDRNVVIEIDPSLMYGPFLDLDPGNYPYCVFLSFDLSYGSKDANTRGEVSILQAYLTDRGFLETGATGFYGRSTEIGVKRFEYLNQIEVNAVVRRDFREVVKELTCQKYQKISYLDKPIAKSNYSTANSTKVSTVKKTVIPITKVATTNKVSIPTTNANISVTPAPSNPVQISGPTLDNTKISPAYGSFSLSKRNNLYFTFNTGSSNPTICINTSGVDCSLPINNTTIREGINGNLYEAVNISGRWSFTIYKNSAWGNVGSRANIYLRDSVSSNTLSIYSISVSN